MNTKGIGDRSTAMVLATLVKAGRNVLIPWGDNLRYDLAFDRSGELIRVQCKTGKLSKDRSTLVFPACSSSVHRGGVRKGYLGEADYFGVYCHELERVSSSKSGRLGTAR